MRRPIAILLVLGAVAACSNGSNDYGNGTAAAFHETCTVNQQQPERICGCMYDEIRQQIPFDRYVELDKQMQKDEKVVPDELVSIAADCATQLTTTTTESTTTTTTESTTTTTAPASSSSSSSANPSSSSPSSGF